MTEVVNLRTARKRAKRQADERRSAKSRLAHGRSKAERTLAAARNEKSNRDLELHRIATGDD
jgi:hypothetical protein